MRLAGTSRVGRLVSLLVLASACSSAATPEPKQLASAAPLATTPAPAPATTPSSTAVATPAPADPLPSWNDGASKRAILSFVARVTQGNGPDFVPVPERVATFDNDGTLWSEQPIYIQLAFALERVR